jgi:tetratricopeptide (TPR) repeat protein
VAGEKSSASFPATGHPPPATPKIADFGLAKLVGDSGQTASGAPLGTPSYMAPELAEGKGGEAGQAADVYGLGAILYECLTGRPPFKAATPLETVRQVCTREPVPPAKLQPHLPRDLEIICLKCLEKEPRKRYPSAGALADDLQRFLDGRPIQARPAPWWERAWKRARRRPLAAASLTAAAVALLALLTVWAVFTVQLDEARRRAERNAEEREGQRLRAEAKTREAQREWRRAEDNREKTLEAVDRFLTRVGDKKLADIPGVVEVRRDLLTDALQFFQAFLKEKENTDPALRRQAAQAAQRTYRIHGMLGQSQEQHRAIQLAVSLLRPLADEFPDDPDLRYDLSMSLHALATWHSAHGRTPDRLDQAEKNVKEALALRQELVRQHPDKAIYKNAVARAHSFLSTLYQRTAKRLPQAEKALQDALAIREELARDFPTPAHQSALAASYHNVAWFAYNRKRLDEAEQYWIRCRETSESLARARPGDVGLQDSLARSYQYLAIVYTDLGRIEPALEMARKALATHEQIARDHRSVPAHRHFLAMAYNNLGRVYDKAGKRAETREATTNAVAVLKELVRDHPGVTGYQFDVARMSANLGISYSADGKLDEMQAACKEAVVVLEPLARAYPKEIPIAVELGRIYLALSNAQVAEAEPLAARPDWLQRGVDVLEGVLRQAPTHHEARHWLSRVQPRRAKVLLRARQPTAALAALGRAEELGHPQRDWLRVLRAAAHLQSGDSARATPEVQPLDTPAFLGKNAPYHLFLAYIYAGAAEAVEKDDRQTGAERDRLASQNDSRAVALLASSLALGHLPPPAEVAKWSPAHKADGDLKVFEAIHGTPRFAFLLARGFSRAAGAQADGQSPNPEQARKTADLDRQALACLRCAHARGYFNAAARVRQLKSDPDLGRLRDRPEYRKLLSDVETAIRK